MPPVVVFSWPYGLIFLAVMFWAFAPEFRIISRQTEPMTSAQDAGSKRLIAVGQGLGMLGAFIIAASVPAGRIAHPFALFWAGLATIIAGSLLRRHCWRMLGRVSRARWSCGRIKGCLTAALTTTYDIRRTRRARSYSSGIERLWRQRECNG
jgi:hypothetical protein